MCIRDSTKVVLHLAALSNDPIGNLNSNWTNDINNNATVRMAEMAKKAGVERFIFSSSCIMYGNAKTDEVNEDTPVNPNTDYAKSKVLAEQKIMELSDSNFAVTSLRNGTVYGYSKYMRFDTVTNDFVGSALTNKKIIIKSAQVYEFKFQMNLNTIAITELEIINNYNNQSMVGAATSIGAKDLEIIKPMGTQEILERVPGINGFSDDGIGNSRINIGIRGINPRRSSRVLILEDGIPIQPALYVYPNMYYNPPSERISEVEVVKGSGAISLSLIHI